MDRIIEFVSNHWILCTAFVIIVFLLGQDLLSGINRAFKMVQPADATLLINREDAVVLDIRDEKDFKQGHILNAIHVPIKSLEQKLNKIEKYKEKPVIVSCRTGQQSQNACGLLAKKGFQRLYNLKGGVLAWQGANLPLAKS